MQKVFKNIVEKLEEKARFYNSASDVDQNIRSGVIIAKEIVQETAAEYEVCYKDCGECEAYDKEKYHCPKFCKVITEAVKEIEENRNGWIPCSERLPEEVDHLADGKKKKQYLVMTRNGRYEVAEWLEVYDEPFWCSHYAAEVKDIVYWKPLEPYQQNGE